MKKMWRIVVLTLFVLALTACSGESGSEQTGAASGGSTPAVADGSFPFMGEAELDQYLKDNAGRPTMLFFWATWCPSCKQQIPELEALHQSHGDRVNVVALSMDDKIEALEKYAATHPMNLPVYFGDQALARKFNIEAIPTMVIYDKAGKLIFNQAGVFPQSMLGAMVDKLNQ